MNPQGYLIKARRAQASARLLLADGDSDGACNRAYYAMFDAARAAFSAPVPEVTPEAIKTHRGLIAAFGRHLVQPSLVDVDLGRILNQVERIRLLADYTGEPIGLQKAVWAVGRAEALLDCIDGLLSGNRDGSTAE